jgi:very-short-patch-repair endonuclease
MEFDDALVRDLLNYRTKVTADGSVDPFSLPLPGKISYVPDEVIKKFPGIDAAFGAAVSISLRSELGIRREYLASALDRCESPIEARFLLSLVCSCALRELAIVITDEEGDPLYTAETDGWMERKLYVCPQQQIDVFRVDFALNDVFINPQVKVARMVGESDPRVPFQINNRLVVECDGHDFHERTREQATRDKNRDRELLNAGYPVMRFTGSEIVSSPLKCTNQIMEWLFPKESSGQSD